MTCMTQEADGSAPHRCQNICDGRTGSKGGVSCTVHGLQKITNHESRIFKGHFSSSVQLVTRFRESGLVGVLYGKRYINRYV